MKTFHLKQIFSSTLNGDNKTNNPCESWHKGLNRHLGKKCNEGNIYKTINVLRDENARQMTKVHEFDRGENLRKKSDFYTKLHKKLKNQCQNYYDEPDKIKYLTNVSFNQEFDD